MLLLSLNAATAPPPSSNIVENKEKERAPAIVQSIDALAIAATQRL